MNPMEPRSDERREVRVRVAPSPTGDPHVGTGYIALFNYVFARSTGGRFILRIEDTDRARSNLESERQIIHSLRWLGLSWDEGPDVGGAYGPYRQSERCETYRRYASELLASGAAYPCFCSPERIARLREEQKRQKLPTLGYDRHCRMTVSPQEARRRIAAGEPHVIRLDVPDDGETVVRDRIRGEVRFPNKDIDDQVLLKSDGFPTYHLANVVDDHLMRISHVIRAEEWLSSTPKHLLIYRAFGWDPPEFIHMPLLRNPDRSKISKRKNPTSLLWYENEGYLPEALVNFLALMGWSVPEGREKFSLDEMIAEFTWDRVTISAPVFDLKKLDWLNGVYIRELPPETLARRLRETVLRSHAVDDATLMKTLPLVRERMKKLTDYVPLTHFIHADAVNPQPEALIPQDGTAAEALRLLGACEEAFRSVSDWNAASLEACGRRVATESGMEPAKVFMTLRVALTGSTASPPLFESMEVVGRERTLARIAAARRLLAPRVTGK